MSADVSYPPVFPWLLAAGISVVGPVPALVGVALIAKGLLVVAVYICCRPLGRPYALAAALCSGAAGAQLEAFAWGGYPQLMATGFALIAVFFAVRWVGDKSSTTLALAFVFAVLTFASHTLIAGLLIVALPVAVLYWLLLTRAQRDDWLKGTAGALSLVMPGAIFMIVTRVRGSQEGVSAVLNPYQLDLLVSIQQTIRDAAVPWIVIAALGVAGVAARKLKGPWAVTAAVGSCWAVVGLAFFLVTGEPRALLLTQIGLIMLASLAVRRVISWTGDRSRGPKMGRIQRAVFPVTVIVVISMVSAIVAGGIVSYAASTDWYRVANADVLESLDWLNDNSEANDLMVASDGPNGNPLGWWVQGYGERRTYTGIDIRFLAFSDEREQAEIANRIFDRSTSPSTARALIDEHGIDYLIIDRRGSNAGWLTADVASSFETLWNSNSVVILKADSE